MTPGQPVCTVKDCPEYGTAHSPLTGTETTAARERRDQTRDAARRRADIERRHERRPGGSPGRTNSLDWCAEDNQEWPCDAIWLLGQLRIHEATCPAETGDTT